MIKIKIISITLLLLIVLSPALSYANEDDKPLTPLEKAAQNGDYKRFMQIAGSSSIKNQLTGEKSGRLAKFTVEGGNEDVFRFLIENGMPKEKYDFLIHDAASGNHPEIIKIMVENGVDVNSYDYWGKTPLQFAVRRRNLETIKCLLDLGAEPGFYCEYSHALGRILSDNGYREDKDDNEDKVLEILKLMDNYGILDKMPNDELSYLLWCSTINIYDKNFKYLIARGVDVNNEFNKKNIPLFQAVPSEDLFKAVYLLDHGARIDIRNDEGALPIHYAGYLIVSNYNKENIIKRLIPPEGINARDNSGNTPLHYMAECPIGCLCCEGTRMIESMQASVLMSFVQNGADVNARNYSGQTPLHKTIEYDNQNVAINLMKHGADPYIKDNNGKTPVQLALDSDNLKLAFLFVSLNPVRTMFHHPLAFLLGVLIIIAIFQRQKRLINVISGREKNSDEG